MALSVLALAGPCGELAPGPCAERGVARVLEGDAAGLALVEDACSQSEPSACYRLASALLDAPGIPSDPPRAVRLLGVACDAGQADACADLGQLLAVGHGTERDPPAARARTRRACELGAFLACSELAGMMVAGFGGPTDPVTARAVAVRTCERTLDGASCARAAALLESGIGGAPEPAGAQRLHGLACGGGAGPSCTVAATRARSQGRASEARDLANRGCAAEQPSSCMLLGLMTLSGEGGSAEPAAALSHLTRACELGSGGACQAAGALLLEGTRVPGDEARARELVERACELDSRRCP